MTSRWIPEKDRDTAWYLFNGRYLCKLQFIHTLSDAEINRHGVRISGIPILDKLQAEAFVEKYLTINEIVELHKKGVPIFIRKKDDLVKICQYITDHLLAWERHIQNNVNIQAVPSDDLDALSAILNKLYDQLDYISVGKVERITTNPFSKIANRNNIINRSTIVNSNYNTSPILDTGVSNTSKPLSVFKTVKYKG